MVRCNEATMAKMVPPGVKGPVNRALVRYAEWLVKRVGLSQQHGYDLLTKYTHNEGTEVAGTFSLKVSHLVPLNEKKSLIICSATRWS